MKLVDGSQSAGEFLLGDQTLTGDLKVNGSKSTIELHSRHDIGAILRHRGDIHGVLKGNTKVSLIDCVSHGTTISHGANNERYYTTTLFPHYILSGTQHISSSDEIITGISFLIPDAKSVFYDTDAFGSLSGSDEELLNVIRTYSRDNGREPDLGDHPWIYWYGGKRRIIEVPTSTGKISANHSPTMRMPHVEGVRIDNSIPMRIEFNEPCNLETALREAWRLQRFLETVIGRTQSFDLLKVLIPSEPYGIDLEVISTMSPKNKHEKENLHPTDLLVNGGLEPRVFEAVMSKWLDLDTLRRDARMLFINSFRKNSYSVDRFLTNNTMFELLPLDATGVGQALPSDLASDIEKMKELLEPHKQHHVAQSIYGALGRAGDKSLKSKIKHREEIVREQIGGYLPDLDPIISEAVLARNYFIHGTDRGKLNTTQRYKVLYIMNDTLEFIFGASDLIDCGWDIKKWVQQGSCLSHPFNVFVHNIGDWQIKFEAACAESANAPDLA